MQADTGLHFVNTIDNQQAIAATRQLNRAFKQLQQQATTAGSSIDTFISRIATATGITIGAATLKNLATQVMNVRGEFQQLEIAFATMLGSADKANRLMLQLTHTAATTPFDLKGIASGAKQLLAYGIAAEDVNQTLINLGDIAAGLSIPLNDMVMLYGTTMVQGRMFTQDLRQFMGRGIPLVQALADTMGIAREEVQDLVSAGKVGAQEFQTALMSLVAEGGQFGGLMEKQSQSITGQISNISDSMDMMFNENTILHIFLLVLRPLSSAVPAIRTLYQLYKNNRAKNKDNGQRNKEQGQWNKEQGQWNKDYLVSTLTMEQGTKTMEQRQRTMEQRQRTIDLYASSATSVEYILVFIPCSISEAVFCQKSLLSLLLSPYSFIKNLYILTILSDPTMQSLHSLHSGQKETRLSIVLCPYSLFQLPTGEAGLTAQRSNIQQ